jgi:hypothetical protein
MYNCLSRRFFGQTRNITFFTLFLLSLIPISVFAGTYTVFGPEDIVRESKRSKVVSFHFSVPNPNISYILEVYNGGMEIEEDPADPVADAPPILKKPFFSWVSKKGDRHQPEFKHANSLLHWKKKALHFKREKFPFFFLQDRPYHLVSSANVILNGQKILVPRDFKRRVYFLEKPITAGIDNTLSIKLKGKPGSGLTLRIVGADNDPPVITATIDPLPNSSGWHNQHVTVTFHCEDTLSGVASCPDPVVVNEEGAGQIVGGTTEDKAGNTASTSVTIHLDRTPPVISASALPLPNSNGWNNTDVDVSFSGIDNLSGMDTVTPMKTVGTEGADQWVEGTAADLAGNVSHDSIRVNIDKTPPTLTKNISPVPNSSGWNNIDTIVNFIAVDGLSGVESHSPPVTLTTEGANQLINGTATDMAGNTETAQANINLDKTPPSINATVSPPPNPAGWNNTDVKVVFAASDALSGLSTVTPPAPIATEGMNQTVSGTAVDLAGNPATTTVSVNIDKTPPVLTLNSPNSNLATNQEILTVSGTAVDANIVSGVSISGYSVTMVGNSFQTNITLLEGENPVTALATDVADNSTALTRTVTFYKPISTFAPVPLSYVALPGKAYNVDVKEDFAFVAAGAEGLQVVNVSNRRSPFIVGSLKSTGTSIDVKVVGNLAFIANVGLGLWVVDISNPSNPVSLGSAPTVGGAFDVMVSGSRAMVVDGAGGLQVFDVTEPAHPFLLGSVPTPGTGRGVDISRTFAVVADGTAGVQIIDIQSPMNPQIVGTVDTPRNAQDVVVDGDTAFIADHTGSLQIVDFSDPYHPAIVGFTHQGVGGTLFDVAQSGYVVFGADAFFTNFVPMIDVSDPSHPAGLQGIDFSSFRADMGFGIAVDSRYVYVATQNPGAESRLYIGQYLDITDNGGISPMVILTSPSDGDTLVEGETIQLSAIAVDDILVKKVEFLVNGIVVTSDTTNPYQFDFTIPVGVSSLTIGARVVDHGGNIGLADGLNNNVMPDLKTTVVGRVVDSNGTPVSGATVTMAVGTSVVTEIDGIFLIPTVPTVLGDLVVKASATISGNRIKGVSSPFFPVAGGTTDIGDLVIVP